MSRYVQLVVLSEDEDQETFARRFLVSAGWPKRGLRFEKAPPGQGSAEQFVRRRFPVELSAYRSNRNRVAQGLVVLVDGDNRGVQARLNELARACQAADIPPRQEGDRVVVAVPTWNIETWLAYLSGVDVDEVKADYPRLRRPRDCQQHVDRLLEMCRQRALRTPAPPSLEAACAEYRSRLQP